MTRQRLDKAKERTGTDAKTAELLDVSPQHLHDFRTGKRLITPAVAVRLAHLLGEPKYPAICLALAWATTSTKNRIFWLDMATGVWDLRRHPRELAERPRFTFN